MKQLSGAECVTSQQKETSETKKTKMVLFVEKKENAQRLVKHCDAIKYKCMDKRSKAEGSFILLNIGK